MSSARVTSQTFDMQMTATLRAKNVKNMNDLIKHYKTITEALDETAAMGLAEGGKSNYESAKNMTLRFKKRGKDFDELKQIWGAVEGVETGGDDQAAHEGAMPEAVKKLGIADQNQSLNIDEIKSDRDLAIVLSSMIQEAFYNPETGFWSKYDAAFDRKSFIALGKPGWESNKSGAAREPINRRKNEEIGRVLENEFSQKTVESVFEAIRMQVYDIKRKDVKHGVKNHVRFHIYSLIYGNS